MRAHLRAVARRPATAEIPFSLCTDPGEFLQLATAWSRCPELWIDTETADWQTSHPRLSLLQVRTPDDGLFVVDILAPGMRAVLETAFVPAVMANAAIRKWAHSASYERRFLGGERVQNLQCTLRLAKSIPYHRLPTRKLTLAALAAHLYGSHVDKSHQADDWGVRPLSAGAARVCGGRPRMVPARAAGARRAGGRRSTLRTSTRRRSASSTWTSPAGCASARPAARTSATRCAITSSRARARRWAGSAFIAGSSRWPRSRSWCASRTSSIPATRSTSSPPSPSR